MKHEIFCDPDLFRPVSIRLTFETQAELNAFLAVVNHSHDVGHKVDSLVSELGIQRPVGVDAKTIDGIFGGKLYADLIEAGGQVGE